MTTQHQCTTPVFIDKISLTFAITDPEHHKWITGAIIDLPKELDSGWHPARGGAYRYAARVHPALPANDLQGKWAKDYVLLQADPRNGQGGFLRAEWNPARFSDLQRYYIFRDMDDQLGLPPPEIWKAQVTRADIAIDLPGVRVGDYVFERSNSPFRSPIIRIGCLETLYLGKPMGGQTCIYDKGAQLGDDTFIYTRVEVHCRPNRTADELFTLKNPFHRIRVYDILKAELPFGSGPRKTLLRAAQAHGISATIGDYPTGAALEYKAAIEASKAAFWKPDTFWKGWPAAVQAALPSFGNPANYGTTTGLNLEPTFVQLIAQTAGHASPSNIPIP